MMGKGRTTESSHVVTVTTVITAQNMAAIQDDSAFDRRAVKKLTLMRYGACLSFFSS